MTSASGFCRGTAGRSVCFNFLSPISRTKKPRRRWRLSSYLIERGNNPGILSEYCDFQRKCLLRSKTLTRSFTPLLCAPLKMRYLLNRYYVIIAIRGGAVGGQAFVPPFIVPVLGISRHSLRNSTGPVSDLFYRGLSGSPAGTCNEIHFN
jgi:hypothetical protein